MGSETVAPGLESAPATERGTFTQQESADYIGISLSAVQMMCKRGDLPVLRIGRRVLLPRSAVISFVERGGTLPGVR